MSTPKQETSSGQKGPAPETIALFYPDAPARPGDGIYARWLEVARADRAAALKVILENEQLLAKHGGETPKELRGFCDLPTMLRQLRDQARDNDAIAREIIADPSSANSRRRMENALATVAGRRV
jgi:hypothetical protein